MKKIVAITLTLLTFAYAQKVPVINNYLSTDIKTKSWLELRNKNVEIQKYDTSCGAAALATILKYFYYKDVSELDIINFFLRKKGLLPKKIKELRKEDFEFSFKDLKEFAEQKGFNAVGLALPVESLKALKFPGIIYIKYKNYQHFTVFKGMDDKFVYLADPMFGNIVMKINRFKKLFYIGKNKKQGKILVIYPKNVKNLNQIFIQKGKNNLKIIYETIIIKSVNFNQ